MTKIGPHQIEPSTTDGQVMTTLDGKSVWADGTGGGAGGGGATTDTWHDIAAFSGTWVNYGGSEQVAGYMIDGAGNVHLRGTIKAGAIGTVAFTLPAGYRPSSVLHFPALTNNGSVSSLGEVAVLTDGGVGVYPPSSNGYVRLDGVSFSTV